MSIIVGENYADLYLPALHYGYEDFLAIKRQDLLTEGPIVQYVDNFNITNMTLFPFTDLSNNATQTGDYSPTLIGQGFDPVNFSQDRLSLRPTFTTPILCDKDNIPAPYVFELFDIARKSIYGDAVEHCMRVVSITDTTINFSAQDKFILSFLKQNLLMGGMFRLRLVDGISLKNLGSYFTITNIDVNGQKITVSTPAGPYPNPYIYAVIVLNQNYTQIPIGLPQANPDYQKSIEFYLASSRDGVYYPCLLNSLTLNIQNQLPILNIECVAKRANKSARLVLDPNAQVPSQYPVYSVSQIEQARIKISVGNKLVEFYGILPVVQDGTQYTNPIFAYKSGIHFGQDTADMTNPNPILIRQINITINNNLTPVYTIHSPRFSDISAENFLNDLSRYDNNCVYAFYSTARKITGTIQVSIPSGDWFKKDFLPAISSNTEGSIEIDTGYFNIKFPQVVFNLAPGTNQVDTELLKQAAFSFASTQFDAMFEIGLSKTGGRL